MASACGGEVEELISCPICLCVYDDVIENRKPKYLSCSHTVCLQCLKGLQNSFLVSCPLCRKILHPSGTLDIASVPTNTYALCILKMMKSEPKPAEPVKRVSLPNWCLTCGSIGKIDCPTLHSTLDMTAQTMSNVEALLAVKEHYARVKEPIRSKLETAVEKEKELQSYLDKILQAIKSLQIETTKLDEESKLRLAGMVSQLDSRLFSTGSKEEENDAFLSELFSLVNSSHPEETLETLKKKMEESFKEIETNLNSSEAVSELPDLVNSTKIAVKLFAEDSTPLPCPILLEKGFISKLESVKEDGSSSTTRRDLLLLSHLIFCVRNRHPKWLPIRSETPSTPPLIPSMTILPSSRPTITPLPRFIQDKCVFVLTLKHSRIVQGRILIRQTLNCPFIVKDLGDLCFHKARALTLPCEKAVSGVYANVPLTMSGFQPPFPNVKGEPARRPLDVGLIKFYSSDVETTPNKWALIFLLEKCLQPNFEATMKPLKSAILFGRVVEGQEALIALSETRVAERSGYTFTLETKEY